MAADLLVIDVEAVFIGGTVVGLHLDALRPDDEELEEAQRGRTDDRRRGPWTWSPPELHA